MRAFVTGGTGFIGSRVVKRLRDRGDEVVVLARRPEKASGLDAEVVQGDLSDADAIRRGVEGCQAVFHIAADYRVGMDPSKQDSMRDSNIGGTERVLDAAVDAGVDRIVYVSTINIFGNTNGQTVDESYRRDEADGFVSTYDETKYRAHVIAEERAAQGAPIVIVQPGSVYGPGDHALVGQMIEQASTGKMPAKAFPELGPEHGARGRRGRRDHARLRQGEDRRVVRAGRRDHDPGRPDRQGGRDRRQEAAAHDGPADGAQGPEPGEPLGRPDDGPAAELPRDDLRRPQRHVLGEGRQGARASWATARATSTRACARRFSAG